MTQREMPDSVSISGLVQPDDWPWRHWRQVRAEAPALRLNDEVLSWSELCTRVDHLASGFAAQGVEEGDGVVASRLESSACAAGLAGIAAMWGAGFTVNPQLPQIAA